MNKSTQICGKTSKLENRYLQHSVRSPGEPLTNQGLLNDSSKHCEKPSFLTDDSWTLEERDLAEWLVRLTANAKVVTSLGLVRASSDTVESERRQKKQCWIKHY